MDIPYATDFSKTVIKNKKIKSEETKNKIIYAANKLEKKLTSLISEKIKRSISGTELKFHVYIGKELMYECVGSIMASKLWYGKFSQMIDGYHKAEPLPELKPSIFEKIQQRFAEYGYTVIEVTDKFEIESSGFKIFNMKFCVYSYFPKKGEDKYFDISGACWHKHNMWLVSNNNALKAENIIEEKIYENTEKYIEKVDEHSSRDTEFTYEELIWDVTHNKERLVTNLILYRFADIKDKELEEKRALNQSIINGNIKLVTLLLSFYANYISYKTSAFLLAVRCNNLDIVKLSLKMGADIHAKSELALILALYKGFTEIVEYLVNNAADVHQLENYEQLKVKRIMTNNY